MASQPEYNANSEAVRTHLTILQDVIRRMAGNSASCKNWCVVLVAAILVLVVCTGAPAHALLALIPTALFLFLDAYYLALEQAFRHSYNAFVTRLHDGAVTLADLYVVRPGRPVGRQMLVSLRSTSVWPFYLALVVAILLVWALSSAGAPGDWFYYPAPQAPP
jgi:hypothetical protein